MNSFEPFADDAAAITLDELSVENGTQAIAVHGQIDITRDKRGLEKARALADLFTRTVAVLEGDKTLPEREEKPRDAGGTVENPFA